MPINNDKGAPIFTHRILCERREGYAKDRSVTCMHVGKANSVCTILVEHFNLYLYTYLAIEGLSGGEITW